MDKDTPDFRMIGFYTQLTGQLGLSGGFSIRTVEKPCSASEKARSTATFIVSFGELLQVPRCHLGVHFYFKNTLETTTRHHKQALQKHYFSQKNGAFQELVLKMSSRKKCLPSNTKYDCSEHPV